MTEMRNLPSKPPPSALADGPQTADQRAARQSATPSSEGSAGGPRHELQAQEEHVTYMHTCVRVCVCRGDGCFVTPDVAEGVVRFAELQQAAVFVQFTDEREQTEEQPVGSLFVLLLLDLQDIITDELQRTRTLTQPRRWRRTHIFIVVGANLSLQQGQQGVQAAGELLLLDLHKQTTNLSAESLEADLGSED